jgi:hypothetical protein
MGETKHPSTSVELSASSLTATGLFFPVELKPANRDDGNGLGKIEQKS